MTLHVNGSMVIFFIMPEQQNTDLREAALGILRENDIGRATKPSPNQYPHLWNWDTAFIAIGYSHSNPERAELEIEALLDSQWDNGMVPHILFTPGETRYFPGPDVWQVTRNPFAPRNGLTSGITQPPILAVAALKVFKNNPDKKQALAFLRKCFPGLKRFIDFFLKERNPDGTGLTYIVHSWESGLDNSPRWDPLIQSIQMEYQPEFNRLDTVYVPASQRPSNNDYSRYIYLLEQYRDVDYDQKAIFGKGLFLVQPVLFNCLFYWSLRSMETIAHLLGESSDYFRNAANNLQQAIQEKLWNRELQAYFDWNIITGQPLLTETVSSFAPLFTGICTEETAFNMARRITNPKGYWPVGGYAVCSTPIWSPSFDPENYWRGPVWININWLIIRGLQQYGFFDQAEELTRLTLELVTQNGFREHYHPQTGVGGGAQRFSWTAALVLDLLHDRPISHLTD